MREQHRAAVDPFGEARRAQFGWIGNYIISLRPMEIRKRPIGDFVETRSGETVATHDRIPHRLLVARPLTQAERSRVSGHDAEMFADARPKVAPTYHVAIADIERLV